MLTNKYNRFILFLAVLAAVLYNDWFLGYFLNSQVAKSGLTSVLEANGQPDNWLFILTDVLTGFIICLMVYTLTRKIYLKARMPIKSLLVIGLLMFGVFTAASALMPLNCGSQITRCGAQLKETYGWHDVTGGIAAFGLFIALVGLVNFMSKFKIASKNKKLAFITIYTWSASGISYLIFTLLNRYYLLARQVFVYPAWQ